MTNNFQYKLLHKQSTHTFKPYILAKEYQWFISCKFHKQNHIRDNQLWNMTILWCNEHVCETKGMGSSLLGSLEGKYYLEKCTIHLFFICFIIFQDWFASEHLVLWLYH